MRCFFVSHKNRRKHPPFKRKKQHSTFEFDLGLQSIIILFETLKLEPILSFFRSTELCRGLEFFYSKPSGCAILVLKN